MNEASQNRETPIHTFPHAGDHNRPERIEFHQFPVSGLDDTTPLDPDESHATLRVSRDLDVADRTSGQSGLSVARAALANTKPSIKF